MLSLQPALRQTENCPSCSNCSDALWTPRYKTENLKTKIVQMICTFPILSAPLWWRIWDEHKWDGWLLGGKTSQFTERPNCLPKYTSKISRTQSFQSQQDDWKRWRNHRCNNNGAVCGIYCTLGITAGVLHKLIQSFSVQQHHHHMVVIVVKAGGSKKKK